MLMAWMLKADRRQILAGLAVALAAPTSAFAQAQG